MSIQDKITRLQTAKDNIADAITAKGGAVSEGDGFEEFSNDISSIPEGIQVETDFTISEGTLSAASVSLSEPITVNIPDGVTTIGMIAFRQNSLINKVIMSDMVTSIANGDYGVNQGAFLRCSSLTNVILSRNLTHIGNAAFYEVAGLSLKTIFIPKSVQSIGGYAFYNGGGVPMNDVYYEGTEAEWNAINIDGGNNALLRATIHYEYVPN